MPTEYRDASGDSGYNIAAAIEPYSNGEGANEITFRRPVEHLRHRTEVLRQELDDLWAVVSSDRGLTLLADFETSVAWGGPKDSSPGPGTGIFTLTPAKEVRLVPLTTPSGGGVSWTQNDIWNRLTYVFNTTKQFTVRSKLRISAGGNNLLLELFKESGQYFGGGTAVQVTVEGSKNDAVPPVFDPLAGPVLVRVQLSHNGTAITSTWADVITGIEAATLPNTWLAAAVTTGEETVLAVEIARQYLWEGVGTDVHAVAGCDAQAYRITATEFVTHFTPANLLYKGDTLVLDFPSAKDRLAVGGATSLGPSLVTVHRSETPEPPGTRSVSGSVNLMHAIPIAKVIDDDLFFFNGSRIAMGATVPLGSDSTLRSSLSVDTGINAGATLVGAAAKEAPINEDDDLPLAEGTVEEQLQELLEYVAALTGGAVDDVKCITIAAKTGDYIKANSSFMPYGTDPADRNSGEEAHPWNQVYGTTVRAGTLNSALAADDHVHVNAHLLPVSTDKTLGATGARWAAVWAVDMTLTTSLTVPTIHGDGTNLTIHDNLIGASGKTLGLVGTPWVNIWGTTITATSVYTASLYGNTGNITAYNNIVPSGSLSLGVNGTSWVHVYASTVHASAVLCGGGVTATTILQALAWGGGAGGAVLIGNGAMIGTTDFTTYTGHKIDGTGGNLAAIYANRTGISQAGWLSVYYSGTHYALPLFHYEEIV